MAMDLAPPNGFSADNLVFNDDFSGESLNTSNWNTYATSAAAAGSRWNAGPNGGSGLGVQFNAEYFMPSQVSVNNGLSLTAVKQTIAGHPATVPFTSGIVSSYGHLDFDGGYLQISMQEPSGSGSWPALWLMPGKGATGGDNFEIDIQEGGFTAGSANPNDVFAWHLHTPKGTFGGVVDTGVDLTAGYHTYAINWIPGKSITWYLDGRQIAQITSAQAPIPDEPMQLMMNESVANAASSGWRTVAGTSTPQTMVMKVADVQLYQAAGSGESVEGASATSPSSSSGDGSGSTPAPPSGSSSGTPTSGPPTTSSNGGGSSSPPTTGASGGNGSDHHRSGGHHFGGSGGGHWHHPLPTGSSDLESLKGTYAEAAQAGQVTTSVTGVDAHSDASLGAHSSLGLMV